MFCRFDGYETDVEDVVSRNRRSYKKRSRARARHDLLHRAFGDEDAREDRLEVEKTRRTHSDTASRRGEIPDGDPLREVVGYRAQHRRAPREIRCAHGAPIRAQG